MSAKLYIEGGGDSKELHTRLRKAFSDLLTSAGFAGRLPRTVACGGRGKAFDAFKTAHAGAAPGEFVAMLVDSEDPVEDAEKPWKHLKARDGWDRPAGAAAEQALMMVTCMETWIVADRQAMRDHYNGGPQESALPSVVDLESRRRHDIQGALSHATRDCKNAYQKGKRSFEVLGKLDPAVLKEALPAFARFIRISHSK